MRQPRLSVRRPVWPLAAFVANAGSDGPEHSVRSHSERSRDSRWRRSSPTLPGADSAHQNRNRFKTLAASPAPVGPPCSMETYSGIFQRVLSDRGRTGTCIPESADLPFALVAHSRRRNGRVWHREMTPPCPLTPFHHRRFQPHPDQLRDRTVHNPYADARRQFRVWNRIEIAPARTHTNNRGNPPQISAPGSAGSPFALPGRAPWDAMD